MVRRSREKVRKKSFIAGNLGKGLKFVIIIKYYIK